MFKKLSTYPCKNPYHKYQIGEHFTVSVQKQYMTNKTPIFHFCDYEKWYAYDKFGSWHLTINLFGWSTTLTLI